MPDGFPYLLRRTTVAGLGLPTMGASYGLGADALGGDEAIARWQTALPEGVSEASIARQLYLNGAVVAAAEEGARQAILSGLRPGVQYAAGLLPLALAQHLNRPDGSGEIFRVRRRGPRACLAWEDKPSDADFVSYAIYWDEGLGGTPETLLALVFDRDTLEYRTDELDAGAYRFALAYRDAAGNESEIGAVASVTIPERPPAVDDFAVSYDSDTRRATLTWSSPSGGWPSGVRRLAIFDNACPGSRLLAPHANSDPAFRRDDLAPTETTWTSSNLWEGVDENGALAPWRFDVRAILCDSWGSDWGPSVEEALMLILDEPDLSEASAPPVRPELLYVEPIAGAKYRATWRVDSLVGVTQFKIAQDGAEVATVSAVAGQIGYTYESGALTDGASYSVTVRAYSGGVSYAESASLSVQVDSSAPTGDGALSAEVCP